MNYLLNCNAYCRLSQDKPDIVGTFLNAYYNSYKYNITLYMI